MRKSHHVYSIFLGKPSIFHCFPHLSVRFSPGVKKINHSLLRLPWGLMWKTWPSSKSKRKLRPWPWKPWRMDTRLCRQVNIARYSVAGRVKCWSLLFHPTILVGGYSQLTNMFQRGWNHQPGIYSYCMKTSTYSSYSSCTYIDLHNLMYIRYLYIYSYCNSIMPGGAQSNYSFFITINPSYLKG